MYTLPLKITDQRATARSLLAGCDQVAFATVRDPASGAPKGALLIVGGDPVPGDGTLAGIGVSDLSSTIHAVFSGDALPSPDFEFAVAEVVHEN